MRVLAAAVLASILALVSCMGARTFALAASPATASAPWLFVSDIHLDVHDLRAAPNYGGRDTNFALFNSFLAAAHAIDPAPPVIVIAGDFIAHHARNNENARTLVTIARAFDRTFPHAQFVITLGNNDSDCGDYAPPRGGAFLRTVAHAWAPLVDRNGASPNFEATFSADGSYVSNLPLRGLRAVVSNDNFLSIRFDAKCSGAAAGRHMFDTLESNLLRAPVGTQNWVVVHIPPGVDAFSTAHLARRLIVVPFLRPGDRRTLLRILSEPRAHVSLAVAGHTHKFGFRVAQTPGGRDIPVLLVPSISPVFANAPSFLQATVGPSGTLGNVTQFAFDGNGWSRHGDLNSLGVDRFDAPSLLGLVRRLALSAATRARFSSLYDAGGQAEIDENNWRVYVCAANNFGDAAFEKCSGKPGVSFLTARGVGVVVVALSAIGIAILCVAIVLRARRRPKTQV